MGEVSHAPNDVPRESGVEFIDNNTALSADALQDWREQAGTAGRIPAQQGAPMAERTGGAHSPGYMGGELSMRRLVVQRPLGSTALPGYFMQQRPFERE